MKNKGGRRCLRFIFDGQTISNDMVEKIEGHRYLFERLQNLSNLDTSQTKKYL